jgi:predicted nuclease of predicted toxin-antitoxin system
MRVLLDENMPLDFGDLLPQHVTSHLEGLGMKGTKNGALLALARQSYDVLITLDRGILFQHKHSGFDLSILVVRVINSKLETIRARSAEVEATLAELAPGSLVEI